MALIFYIKVSSSAAQTGPSIQALIDALPTLQALYPLLMNAAFSFFIICDKFLCSDADKPKLHYSAVYLVIAELKAYPMVTFMLLRDKKQVIVLISWVIGVMTHFIVAVASGSHQEIVTFLAYTLTSGLILLDVHRHRPNFNTSEHYCRNGRDVC